jgi:uncharacterized membrane protein HdeD (DUF308 family)
MTDHVQTSNVEWPPIGAGLRERARKVTGYWWVGLVGGIAWLAISLVILQFDKASVTTVGVLIGVMFLVAALENVVLASVPGIVRWPFVLFAVLLGAAAIICFLNPANTFAGMADILGFVFLTIGIWWMVRAFLERAINPSWWVGLISGILMTCMAFWTAGQFFIAKAYVLLVFAGIWALMQGINDMVRAFAVRKLHEQL